MQGKSIEKKEHNMAALTIEVTPAEFNDALNEAYRKNRNSIMVPGFRKGKAPRKIIESMYGEAVFYDDAMNSIIPKAYFDAVKENDLKVVADPSVEKCDVTDDKGLEIVLNAALYPEVTLGKYKGLEAVRKDVTVDPYEIEAEIESLRRRNSSISTVDRPAKYDDTVVIDYEGFVDGEAFEGGKGENHSLEIGSNSFIPGFEIQCINASAGDEIEVNVTFPADYHAQELQSKPALFKVKVHEVKERILPELDDEFAKDVSEFDTLDEYRESIRASIEKRKMDAVRNDFLDLLLAQVVENAEIDLSDAMIDDRTRSMLNDYASRLQNQGIGFEQYLQMFNMDIETLEASTRKTAEKQLRGELSLKKIAEVENIEVTDEDREKEYANIAKSYNVDAETVKNFFDNEVFEESCLLTKTADFIIDNAVALPEPPKEEPAEEPTDENTKDEEKAKPAKKVKAKAVEKADSTAGAAEE